MLHPRERKLIIDSLARTMATHATWLVNKYDGKAEYIFDGGVLMTRIPALSSPHRNYAICLRPLTRSELKQLGSKLNTFYGVNGHSTGRLWTPYQSLNFINKQTSIQKQESSPVMAVEATRDYIKESRSKLLSKYPDLELMKIRRAANDRDVIAAETIEAPRPVMPIGIFDSRSIDPHLDIYLFSVDGKDVGTVSLIPNKDMPLIQDLAVNSSYKRRGIGAWMMLFALEQALEKAGTEKLPVAWYSTQGGIPLYKYLGATEVGSVSMLSSGTDRLTPATPILTLSALTPSSDGAGASGGAES